MAFKRLVNMPHPRRYAHRIIPPIHHFFPDGVPSDMLAREGDRVNTVAGCITDR